MQIVSNETVKIPTHTLTLRRYIGALTGCSEVYLPEVSMRRRCNACPHIALMLRVANTASLSMWCLSSMTMWVWFDNITLMALWLTFTARKSDRREMSPWLIINRLPVLRSKEACGKWILTRMYPVHKRNYLMFGHICHIFA